MIRCRGVDKARWLLAVDGLVEVAMEERVLDIQLVDKPVTRGGEAGDDADRCWFDDWAERLVVVDAGALGVAAHDPMGLVTSKGAIGVVLVLEDPLASNDVDARWSRNKGPGTIL